MTATTDIPNLTQGHSSETEILRVQRSLSAVEILCHALNAIPEMVMILNQHRQIVHANQAAEDFAQSTGRPNITGLRPGELFRCRNVTGRNGVCGTAHACSSCALPILVSDTIDGLKTAVEYRVTRCTPDGPEALDFRIWGTPFRWQNLDYALCVAVDISNEKRRQVLERIFLHDILNTAGSLSGLADLLSAGTLSVDDVKDGLCIATRTLVQEIQSHRMLVQAEKDELAVSPSLTQPQLIVEEIQKAFRNHAVAQGKTVQIRSESNPQEFDTDPAVLGRVLGNLLKNALEASAPGERVTLGWRFSPSDISFWCHNVHTMPSHAQNQIFQRSFTTKGQGRAGESAPTALNCSQKNTSEVTSASSPARKRVPSSRSRSP